MHLIFSWRLAAGQWHPGALSPQSPDAQEPSAQDKKSGPRLLSNMCYPSSCLNVLANCNEIQLVVWFLPADLQL